MTHTFPPNLRQSDLDTAFFTYDALEFHSLILAAKAFVILDRTEDAGAEQAVTFRLKSPIVDGFGLLDLAKRPRPDAVGTGDRDFDLIEVVGCRRSNGAKNSHQFIHGSISHLRRSMGTAS